MNPIAVNISGTFSEKQRPNNGMERVGPYLNAHRLARIPIVAYVEWHSHGETRTGEKTAVVIPAIEAGISEAGGSIPGLPVQDGFPADAGGQIMWLLDSIRRAGGKGAVADTLFSVPSEEIHRDDSEDEPRYDGEEKIPGSDPVVRVGADGPHVVPPASGEELTAELNERRATSGPTRAEQETAEVPATDVKADLRRRVTGKPDVPAAAFSGPDTA